MNEYTDPQVAAILNERGSRAGEAFGPVSVEWVRSSAGLTSLKERLIAAGMLTGKQIETRTQAQRIRYNRAAAMQGTRGERTSELSVLHDLAESHRC